MSLVYCNYPILEKEHEPEWVQVLLYVKEKNILNNVDFYRPFVELKYQSYVEKYFSNNKENYKVIKNLLNLSNQELSYEAVRDLENTASSTSIIQKDITILSKCDYIITDCDSLDSGTRASLLVLAKLMGLITININNRFINNPYIHSLGDYHVKTLNLPDLINILSSTEDKPVKEEHV